MPGKHLTIILIALMAFWTMACEKDSSSGQNNSNDDKKDSESGSDGDSDGDSDSDSDADNDTDSDSDADSVSDGDSDTDGDSDSDGDTDADGDSDSDSDIQRPSKPVPVCVKECSGPSDCVEVGADKLHRAPNYTCESGLCKYIGCTNNDNCDDEYPGFNYVCSANGECQYPCQTVADCSLGTKHEDDDNWNCQGGGCQYLGCLNSYECSVEFGSEYTCHDVWHLGVPQCFGSCDAPADCVKTTDADKEAYDGDNYQCILLSDDELVNSCDYLGCSDDAECGSGYRCVKP
ncbi:MAG: hypothetical protein JXR76_23060 [Deltaproteobacteria bacterium]|nr:hypothetical protein [Deltaproteobacteria bacterium]